MKLVLDVLTGLALWAAVRHLPAWWIGAAWLVLAASSLARAGLVPLIVQSGGSVRALPPEVEGRLRQLAMRMGIRAPRASVLDRTGRVPPNALVAGLGRSRRIYVLPALLSLSPAEVDVVLAHELAHVRRRDVELLAALVAVLQVVIVFGLKLWVVRPPLYPAESMGALWYPDFAFVALLANSCLGIVLLPVRRRQEAQADMSALEATRDPAAFRSMIHALASANLSRPESPDLFRCTHPAPSQRIALAKEWERANGLPAPAGDDGVAGPPLASNPDGACAPPPLAPLRRRLALPVAVLVLAVAATLITVPSGSGTATPTSAQIKQRLLTTRELPVGWTRTAPPSMEPYVSSSDSSMTGCAIPFGFGLGSNDYVPAAQAAFVHDSPSQIARMDEVLSYEPATAEVAFPGAARLLDACGHLSMGFGPTTVDFRMRPMSLPTLGDRSAAYALTDPDGVDADLIVAVEHAWIVTVVVTAFQSAPTRQAQHLTDAALSKLGWAQPGHP